MPQQYVEDETFRDLDFSEELPAAQVFEHCTFLRCTFTHVDLSGFRFTACRFEHADLSMVQLDGTAFQDVVFAHCKLMGLRFDTCNPILLSFRFEACVLNFSSFYQLKIPKTPFIDCSLSEVEFIQTDLTGADFTGCDLSGSVFENTILKEADFQTATHFSIDPEQNWMEKAKFSALGLAGLLEKYHLVIE